MDRDLVQHLRTSTKNLQHYTLKTITLTWEALVPSKYIAQGQAPLSETGQWLIDWDVICACKIEVLSERESIYCHTPQKRKFLWNHISYHFLLEIQLYYNLVETPLNITYGSIID